MKPLIEMSVKYIGKSYNQFPCLVLITSFYNDLDINFPQEFEGVTLDNYLEYLKNDKEKLFEILFKFMDTLGTESNINKLNTYDFLAIEDMHKNVYIGIYLRDKMFLTSAVNKGVRVSFIGKYNKVIKARRMV